jgi:alginate O-acetyltransferase complex protein AlgI
LSSFFRDYLYIPLGGNRNFQLRNLFIVWFLTGFWHGASWNFIIWGLFYGFFFTLEKIFLNKILEKIPAFLSHIYLVIIMLTAWVFFYFEDLNYGINYIKTMIGLSENIIINTEFVIHFQNNIIFLILGILLSTPII